MNKYLIKLILLLPFWVLGQNIYNDDTIKINQTINGLKQGIWKKYYPPEANGKLRYEGQFKDNIPVGLFQYYYKTGELKAKLIYHNKGRNASANFFYENGNLLAVGYYTDLPDDTLGMKKDSTWLYYTKFPAGRLIAEERYKNTKKHGTWKSYYYATGQVCEEIFYEDDKKNGCWKRYYEDGQIWIETSYKNDKRIGNFTAYYEDGRLEVVGAYKNGLPFGKWTIFRPNGERKEFEYNEKGKRVDEEEYLEEMNKKLLEYEKIIEEQKRKQQQIDDNIPFFLQE